MAERDDEVTIEATRSKRIEDCILAATTSIRKDRNRASFDNILKFAVKQGIEIDCEELKKVTFNLIERDLLVNKGKMDKESFYIVDKICDGGKSTKISASEEVSSLNALEGFLGDKHTTLNNTFYDSLVDRIKCEIKDQLRSNIN